MILKHLIGIPLSRFFDYLSIMPVRFSCAVCLLVLIILISWVQFIHAVSKVKKCVCVVISLLMIVFFASQFFNLITMPERIFLFSRQTNLESIISEINSRKDFDNFFSFLRTGIPRAVPADQSEKYLSSLQADKDRILTTLKGMGIVNICLLDEPYIAFYTSCSRGDSWSIVYSQLPTAPTPYEADCCGMLHLSSYSWLKLKDNWYIWVKS